MEEFLNKLFESRVLAHALHLKTNSYGGHIALKEYYDAIVDKIDLLAETYQGQFGLLDLSEVQHMKSDIDFNDPLKYFENLSQFVLGTRDSVVNDKSKHLSAIIDEILIDIFQTIYKLKYLNK